MTISHYDPEKPRNAHRRFSAREEASLRASKHVDPEVLAERFGRTPDAIKRKLWELGEGSKRNVPVRPWSKEEDQFVLTNDGVDAMRALKRSKGSVIGRRWRLRKWQAEQRSGA